MQTVTDNPSAEVLSIVTVGHVDHGKSTVVGRLLADSGALPEGKLAQIRALCERTAKPFEYAFLLDALKDEQAQGITIDAARCFFKTRKRHYILSDAPGHVEFLKNMITGAARAEAALLVIDAREGVQENSRRHGYMLSMLGIGQLAVLINKIDLVDYSEAAYRAIVEEYAAFLRRVGVEPQAFIPVSGLHGVNITAHSEHTPWYAGPTVLEQIDAFGKPEPPTERPFRFPVQDVYRFTEQGDDRRIVAGTVQTGRVAVGDAVVFLPSGKRSTVTGVERFNAPDNPRAAAGEAVGFTLSTQVYVKPGELMVRAAETQPQVGVRLRVNLFWMGRNPMIPKKTYKLKLGAARGPLHLVRILNVLDASELTSVTNKQQIDRHDVAECILECPKPVAFDLHTEMVQTGRLVVVDDSDIAGAGIILENLPAEETVLSRHVREREFNWVGGRITPNDRANAYGHRAKFIVFVGDDAERLHTLASALESRLFDTHRKAYCLRMADVVAGLDADIIAEKDARDEHLRRLGELARIMTDAGQIFITSVSAVDEYDLQTLETLNQPNEILIVCVGENRYPGVPLALTLAEDVSPAQAVDGVSELLVQKSVIPDYVI